MCLGEQGVAQSQRAAWREFSHANTNRIGEEKTDTIDFSGIAKAAAPNSFG
jgi:hypothetical protein